MRHFLYESLNFIMTFLISFHILTMNFVIELFKIDDYNVLFIITNKFTKKMFFVIEKDI